MPTYEYRCPEGHEFEKFVQKMSDAQSELPCPTCGKVAPRRMSAGGGLLFKGSGFYITDYGKDGKKDQRPAAKSESGGESKAPTGEGAPGTSGAPAPSAASTPAPAAPPAAAKSDKSDKGSKIDKTDQSAKKSGPAQ